jgi:hypothetical protein
MSQNNEASLQDEIKKTKQCIQHDSISEIWRVYDTDHLYEHHINSLLTNYRRTQQFKKSGGKISKDIENHIQRQAFETTVMSFVENIQKDAPYLTSLMHVDIQPSETSEKNIPIFLLTLKKKICIPESFSPNDLKIERYILEDLTEEEVIQDLEQNLNNTSRPDKTIALETTSQNCFVLWNLKAVKDNGAVSWENEVLLSEDHIHLQDDGLRNIIFEVFAKQLPHKNHTLGFDIKFLLKNQAPAKGAISVFRELLGPIKIGEVIKKDMRFPRTASWGKLAGKKITWIWTCLHIWPSIPKQVDEETAFHLGFESKDQWIQSHKERMEQYGQEVSDTSFFVSLIRELIQIFKLYVSEHHYDQKIHDMTKKTMESFMHSENISENLSSQEHDALNPQNMEQHLRAVNCIRLLTTSLIDALIDHFKMEISQEMLQTEVMNAIVLKKPSAEDLKSKDFILNEVSIIKQKYVLNFLKEQMLPLEKRVIFSEFEKIIEQELLKALLIPEKKEDDNL